MNVFRFRNIHFAALSSLLAAPALAQSAGEILWTIPTEDASPGFRARTAADETIYWNPGHSLYAISPAGKILHDADAGELSHSNPIDFGADGMVYAGDSTFIYAFTPTLDLAWQFDHDAVGFSQGLIGGPNIGPDGNVYATADSGNPNEPGLFSLTADGELRWTMPGFGHNGGSPGAEIHFGPPGQLYVATNVAPTGDDLEQGLFAVELDGDLGWIEIMTVGTGQGPSHHPIVSPLNGNVHIVQLQDTRLATFSPDGDLLWTFTPEFQDGNLDYPPTVGSDGSVFFVTDHRRAFRLSPDGDVIWQTGDLLGIPAFTSFVQLSPDEDVLVTGFGGVTPSRVIALDTSDGSTLWLTELPLDGDDDIIPVNYEFAPDGSVTYVNGYAFEHVFLIAIQAMEATAIPADLDGDGSVGFSDLLILLASWGDCPEPPAECPADIDGSGDVGFNDLLILLAAWTG